MEKQLGFSELELRKNNHKTRREIFLAKMESLVPWHKLVALIEPRYPKAGNGRRPYLKQCYVFAACNNATT